MNTPDNLCQVCTIQVELQKTLQQQLLTRDTLGALHWGMTCEGVLNDRVDDGKYEQQWQ